MDILLLILILIIPTISSLYLNSVFKKYKGVLAKTSLCGQEIASTILKENDLEKIYVVKTTGILSDHYDSQRKAVRLSSDIFDENSIASISVAAHECGHAIQDKENYGPMRLRSAIFPIVKIGTQISYIVILLGLFFQAIDIVYIGIALVSLGLVFQLITLPVEFDASTRALKELKKYNLITEEEVDGVEKVLKAAALTYVAGVIATALDLIRLVLVYGNRRD